MARKITWGVLALPFVYLSINTLLQRWGADPAKEIVHLSGEFVVWLLMLILLATPLARITRASWLIRARRAMGVAMFIYGIIHLMLYLSAYIGWDAAALAEDIVDRPYIIVGALALLLAMPLALTSNDYSVKKLGKHWNILHRFIYGIAPLVVLHILMQVKVDFSEAILYGLYFFMMFVLRYKPLQLYLRSKIN